MISQVVQKEVAFSDQKIKISPLQKLATIYIRVIGGNAVALILDQISEQHNKLDHSALVLDLKKPNARPESIRDLMLLNYSFLLGIKLELESIKPNLKSNSNYRELVKSLSMGIDYLTRDLQAPIVNRKKLYPMIYGLNQDEIKQIKSLPGLPAIKSLPDLIAYNVILKGSGIGAAIQAHRQKKHYDLTDNCNGGAEFLGSGGNAIKQALQFKEYAVKIQRQFVSRQEEEQSAKTAERIMACLANVFEERSNFLIN